MERERGGRGGGHGVGRGVMERERGGREREGRW